MKKKDEHQEIDYNGSGCDIKTGKHCQHIDSFLQKSRKCSFLSVPFRFSKLKFHLITVVLFWSKQLFALTEIVFDIAISLPNYLEIQEATKNLPIGIISLQNT